MLSKLLVTLAKKHKDKMASHLRSIDLYVGQDIFLITLAESEKLTQKELKEKLMVEYATINKIVERLQNRGMVIKSKNPEDLRASVVQLTEKGKDSVCKIQGFWDELENEFFSNLNREEKAQLQQLLQKLKK